MSARELNLLDEDGENRAARTFLMQWGLPGLTIGAMRNHMTRSGWSVECIPAFARSAYDAEHLTKAGAQLWVRHLFGLEIPRPDTGSHVPVPTSADQAQLMVGLGLNYLEHHAPERLKKDPPC